jgi:sulfatase modifying factor 1
MRIWARRIGIVITALLASAVADAGSAPPGMAWIPEGEYTSFIPPAAGPPTTVVAGYFLDVRPVTNTEFLAFVKAQPKWLRSRVSPLFAEPGYLSDWAGDLDLGSRAPAESPVVRVSWFAARGYAAWRGKRLPTIAEWERAASVGFTSVNGKADPAYRAAALGWYSVPAAVPLPAAGLARPNLYGVRDLVSLVWEWVDDFNAANVGQDVACGGSAENVRDFSDYPAFMRAAFRSSLRASYVVPNLGFRCALSPTK